MATEKTLLVCSDIEGTYNKLDDRDILMFFESLQNLKQVLDVDKIVFSFISTLTCEQLKEVVNDRLLPFNIENFGIDIGPHFGSNGQLVNNEIKGMENDNTKAMQLVNYVTSFNENPDSIVTDLMYIDDNPNINPILFLKNIKVREHNLKDVIFLVKNKSSFINFVKKEDYDFNIDVIEDTNDKFIKTGISSIEKQNSNIK